ncbi:zinc finger protein 28 [Danaus plexippus]|uniref:zinc finger protein 28 n=1 Tax=Danaus plexippus TaxID=13037 RepID=UPI002AB0EF07|nr:zinc finger protein 28 [Danaus plexippus]
MLSPHDDDDDNHLCIKCNATIIGLDNYVKHRKQGCRKRKIDSKPELASIDPLEATYNLGADVFFQSLELQSSVKRSPLSRLTPPTPVTKNNIDKKNSLNVASTSRDIPRISPIESNLRGEDWIGGHSLRIGSNEDNQTKLINAVANISGSVKKEPLNSYNITNFSVYKEDNDSEESNVSEEEDEDEIVVDEGSWPPPPNYTGGKWRPASPEQEWDVREEQEQVDRDYDYDAPPPEHTKGKWIPGANERTQIMQTTIQTKGSVQYWCGPCNRRLGSRAIYEKHLKSNLHMRKVLPEQELEFSGSLVSTNNSLVRPRSAGAAMFVSAVYSSPTRKRSKKESKVSIKMNKKKRKRTSCFVQCSGCKTRVKRNLMGKHLISHYHFRKGTVVKNFLYKQLVLNNIDAIVHQAPFQCSPCKFYTNWQTNFMQHWNSEEHKSTISSIEGVYWCSFCKFESETCEEMSAHITSTEHGEVASVINRSMPIIIRKKSVIKCHTCPMMFRYNVEVKHHCRTTGHDLPYSASDIYQEVHRCHHCKKKFKLSISLVAHLKKRHNDSVYFCLLCSKTFNSAVEVKNHRQSTEHRVKRLEVLRERGLLTKDISKKCPYCPQYVVLKNTLELREHIINVHPSIKKKCPKCGKEFIFSQEVSRHIRSNACKLHNPEALQSSITWKCSQCLFVTDSQAECFFHEVLHTEPSTETTKTNKIIKKYKCPLCPKTFRKPSLRLHLRQHTFERPLVCTICGANFTRQSTLANHTRTEHSDRRPGTDDPAEDQTLKCLKCKKTFDRRVSLTHHEVTCEGVERRCPHPDCSYIASTVAQLTRHRYGHKEIVKQYECPHCDFKAEKSSHMKRHLFCHERIKPYACPHCDFTCGSLENLRKHAVHSKLHVGLCLYSCPQSCGFSSDRAASLRRHLTSCHSDVYDAPAANRTVKTLLMTDDAL